MLGYGWRVSFGHINNTNNDGGSSGNVHIYIAPYYYYSLITHEAADTSNTNILKEKGEKKQKPTAVIVT